MARQASDAGDGGTPVGVGVVVVAALVAYGSFVVWLSSRGPLGNDELFTLYFSRLPSIDDVWRQLATGVEQTPPFFYVVTRTSLRLFGDNAVALRVPEAAGVFLGAVCAFAAVARRSTAAYGMLAGLLLLGSQATFYAHEARPYGLVLGLVALGFLCWQIRGDDRGGLLVVGAMTVAVTLAVASHYYAILAIAPIALGESVRTVRRRRVDRAVVAGLVLAGTPLLVAAPLINAARSYSESFWTVFSWGDGFEFNGWLFRTSAVPGDLAPRLGVAVLVWTLCGIALHALVASRRWGSREGGEAPNMRALVGCVVLGVVSVVLLSVPGGPDLLAGREVVYVAAAGLVVLAYRRVARRRFAEIAARRRESAVRAPEIVAAVGFLFVPLLAVAVAKLFTGAYTPRYALPAALGVAVLLPLGLHRIQGKRRLATISLVCVLAAFVARVAWYQHLEQSGEAAERIAITSFLVENALGTGLPIVIGHPQRFFELSHDRPPALSGRILHLSSPTLARRYIGSDSTDAGLLVLRRFAPLDVRRFEQFEAARLPFVLLITPDSSDWNWIVPALEADRRSIRTVASSNGLTLLEVR